MSVPPKRGTKGKGHGEQLIALGTATVGQPSVPVSKSSSKRDGGPSSSSAVAKKPRLDKPITVEPYELLYRMENETSEDRIVGYILSSLSAIKSSRGKDSLSMLTLLYHGKIDPSSFQSEQLIEMLVSFLKRDPGFSFKLKPSNALQIFAANLLLSILRDVRSWSISLVKVFVEDSLAERIWVDTMEVKGLVDNILTGFRTFVPTKAVSNTDTVAAIKAETSNSPSHNEDSSDGTIGTSERLENVTITRRFTTEQEEQIAIYIKDIINEHLTRKPASEIPRNLLRLLMATVGVQSIRFMIAQKLDVWLQNPKLQKPSQDLARVLILNLTEMDSEIIGTLVRSLHKIRSKPIVNHFVSCVKELVLMKEEMSYHFIREAVISFMNEIVTASRGSNNMQLISTILTSDSREKSTKILATLFQELMIKEDCLKSLRILLREVVRTLRYDHLSLTYFVTILVQEHQSFEQVNFNDASIRDRVFQSTIDLVTLCMFLCVSPSVKEAASAPKSDKRDVMKNFQTQIADITRSGILWLQFTAMKLCPDRNEFMHGLNKLLLMEGQEHYCNRDNWPPESERNLIFRLCCEVPFLEDTLASLLNMALARSYPITPTEAIEVADQLIKRAAGCYDGEGISVLDMHNEQIFDLLLNCSTYRIPDNIALPSGYTPPSLAVSDWYWKVWVQLLILTAHNTKTFGHKAWQSFPTLSLLIEMAITSHFEFPPPTQPSDEIKLRDVQLNLLEKQQILQFETHLAAASTKMLINESTSLLMSKLITFDPMGVARKPPGNVLEQLKVLNNNYKLGHLLCQSRNPDFLLEIIQRQQKSKQSINNQGTSGQPVSMPWLNQLVELHEDNFSALPVQCLCEFLLGQIHESSDYFNSGSANPGGSKSTTTSNTGTNNNNASSAAVSSKNNTTNTIQTASNLTGSGTMTSGGTIGGGGTNVPSSGGTMTGTIVDGNIKFKGTTNILEPKKRKLNKLIVFFKNMITNQEKDEAEDEETAKDDLKTTSSAASSDGHELRKRAGTSTATTAKEMIDYFMKRLGCQQSLFRSLASKALDVIMAPTTKLTTDSLSVVQDNEQQQQDFSSSSSSFDTIGGTNNGNNKSDDVCLFLDVLPQTRGFNSVVKQVACDSLRWSLLVETNPVSICKYVKFLADHSSNTDSNVALNLSHLLMERQIVTRAIVSSPVSSTSSFYDNDQQTMKKLKESFLTSANKILYNYLMANMTKDPIQDWPTADENDSDNDERVLVLWQSTGQTIVIHSAIIHAMVMLLIYGPVEGCQQVYEDQMNRWFKQCPSAYSLVSREEEPLWPESLKLFMVKSRNETLVNAGLAELDTRTLVLFIQSFGIPIESMDKLLKLLDDRCQVEEERLILKSNIPDEQFMKHLIEVQWMRGAVNGRKFAAFLGLVDPVKGQQQLKKQQPQQLKKESPSKKKMADCIKSINSKQLAATNSSLSKATKMFNELIKDPLPLFVADVVEEDEQIDERLIQALFKQKNVKSVN